MERPAKSNLPDTILLRCISIFLRLKKGVIFTVYWSNLSKYLRLKDLNYRVSQLWQQIAWKSKKSILKAQKPAKNDTAIPFIPEMSGKADGNLLLLSPRLQYLQGNPFSQGRIGISQNNIPTPNKFSLIPGSSIIWSRYKWKPSPLLINFQ